MDEGKFKLMVRRAILLQLEAASPASLPFESLALGLSLAGLKIDEHEVASTSDYLCQKGLLEIKSSLICASQKRARLTSAGRDYLESGEL